MSQELAKQLCLKVIYGGELTGEETLVVESFTQTVAGQEYMSMSREMKNTLEEIADVELLAEARPAMIERFENTVRNNALESQKRFPLAVFLLVGPISLLLLLSMAISGWNAVTLVLLGVLAVFGILSAIMRSHHQRLISEGNILQLMKAGHAASRKVPNRILAILVAMMPAVFVGWGFSQSHGPATGAKYFFLCLAFTLCITGLLTAVSRHTLRSKDPEMWDWWQEGLGD